MKKIISLIIMMMTLFLTSCNGINIGVIGGEDGATSIVISNEGEKSMYEEITPDVAKEIMDSEENVIIIDAREQDEYDEGHIPGAILIPYTEIENKAEYLIPDKESIILVYCRSGRRSKIASESLAELGYTNVLEFGGIIDWPYDIVK